jgi:hypothetical protein
LFFPDATRRKNAQPGAADIVELREVDDKLSLVSGDVTEKFVLRLLRC